MMKVEFVGATDDVTGSMSLLCNHQGKILIDCGMYQGDKQISIKNNSPFPFDAKEIKAIILTHAHLDHCGLIPKLIKEGFRGEIYSTRPTMKLARIIMQDSAKILENDKNPIHGLYDLEDAVKAPSFFRIKNYHEKFEVIGLEVYFIPAGHILGASSVVIKGEKTVVFSGDLGRFNDPVINPPEFCPETDFLVVESTYGDRYRKADLEEDLKKFLDAIETKNRVGIIASFAVARGQLILVMLAKYFDEHPQKRIRVVMDGPMMYEANKIYKEFAESTRCPDLIKYALSDVEVIDQERKWLSLQKQEGPIIILSSSGMVSGGRILRHLENWQQDENALLFLPGFQGKGTPGRSLSEGKRVILNEDGTKIHWHGEVMTSEAFSSHADQEELHLWLKNLNKKTHIYLNHGEEASKKAFKKRLNEEGFLNVFFAEKDNSVTLSS